MTDFSLILEETDIIPGFSLNPYAAKNSSNEWIEGFISINYLNNNFSEFETAGEMKNGTESEGLKLYFNWLKEQGILN